VAGSIQVLRSATRNGSMRRLLAAFFLFNAQEYAVWIAVVVYAFDRGGAATAGAVLVAQLIPAAVVAPFTSVAGDRLRRDVALTVGYLIQAVACLGLALAIWKAPPLIAYAAAVVASCAVTFTRPSHNAVMPELADTPEQLTAANAATGLMEGLGTLVGPGLNAATIVAIGPAGVVALMGVFMLGAAALTFRLALYRGVPHIASPDVGSLIGDVVGGVRELGADPGAALLLLISGSQFLLIGLLDVFSALLAIEVLDIGNSGAGVFAAGFGVGGIVGASSAVMLARRGRLSAAMVLALMACGTSLAFLGLANGMGVALVMLAACGAARSVFDVASRTLMQRAVKESVLARVFGLAEALQMIGLAVGSAAAPLLVSWFGERGAFVAAGVILLSLAAGSWRPLGRTDSVSKQPGPDLELLRSISIFAPLPEHVAEQLSWHLISLEAAEGTVIVRQGDPGDRFYIVVEGTMAVTIDGAPRRDLQAGSFFGEIALLRDVPRTATVTARTACRLLALERQVFLQAVTGSIGSLAEADRGIERHVGT
jgi:MFS family permease